jgi:hypothetical protein
MRIREFVDGSYLEYARGTFDEHCVYLTRPTRNRHAPKDIEYFAVLKRLSDRYGTKKVYADFVKIYEQTSKDYDYLVADEIRKLSSAYGIDSLEAEIALTTIYAAMIGEEKKANTKLGKRVKRLGIHQLLAEEFEIEKAATFSKGMKWREIEKECVKRGF